MKAQNDMQQRLDFIKFSSETNPEHFEGEAIGEE